MDINELNKFNEELDKMLNEESNSSFPKGSFAEWFGEDLTGQVYKGSIICFYENLTSLFGCPKEVTRNFICDENQLTSLEGAPEKVC